MKYLVLFAALWFSNATSAQIRELQSLHLGAGLDFSYPQGVFNNLYRISPGGTLKLEYGLLRRLSLTAAASYLSFGASEAPTLAILPTLCGVRYYMGQFYAGAEAGRAFSLNGASEAGWMYAISLGDEIVSKRNGNSIDVGLRLQWWQNGINRNFYGLRVAYEFQLR